MALSSLENPDRLRPRYAVSALGLVSCALLIASCAAHPGPAPVEQEDTEATTAYPEEAQSGATTQRTQLTVGIDPLSNGLNPHLLADNSRFVSELADLVLPSAFRAGVMDEDLLVSAEAIDPAAGAAQTVRYVIQPSAQWSDGTPISALDFSYLWRSMISTPGVIGVAPYRAISAIRSSGGGKTVEVDFQEPVAQWQDLFADLLPAHLLGDSDFATALSDSLPASGGRFTVSSVDRSRQIVELNRNDRFWGSSPAATEVITFRAVSDYAEGTDQVRSGQMSFLEVTPGQTDSLAYELVSDSQVRAVSTGRMLSLVQSVSSPLLSDADARAALAVLLNRTQVAQLATGRTDSVSVPDMWSSTDLPTTSEALALMQSLTETAQRPLIVAADVADTTAASAARAIVDSLTQLGVPARLTLASSTTLTSTRLPTGEVDAIVAWGTTQLDSVSVPSTYGCTAPAQSTSSSASSEAADSTEQEATEDLTETLSTTESSAPESSAARETESASIHSSESTPSSAADVDPEEAAALPRYSNLSGYCSAEIDVQLRTLLQSGSEDEAAELAEEIEAQEHLSIPLLEETTLMVLGTGMVGPAENLADWPEGISSAAVWRQEESEEE